MIRLSRFLALEFSAGGGPLTQTVSQRLGALLAYGGQWLGATPNMLTACGLLCYVAAAGLYGMLPEGIVATVLCMFVYQLAYGFDCADGQLARAQKRTSEFGAWWDISADTVSALSLAFAMLYWLTKDAEILEPAVLMAVLVFAAGRVLILYSSKSAATSRRGTGGGSRGASVGQTGKWLLWLLIDTPTVLFLVCLLRDFAVPLTLYVAAIGLAACANAVYLGLTKLQRA